ncbi:MAG: hypothetical protein RR198_00770 [Oscillospiraceae bacterium]
MINYIVGGVVGIAIFRGIRAAIKQESCGNCKSCKGCKNIGSCTIK